MTLRWKVDECASYFDRMKVRGWCFSPEAEIVSVEVLFPAAPSPVPLASFGLPSPDIAAAIDPTAHCARFDEWIDLPDEQRGRDFKLRVRLADGRSIDTGSVHTNCREGDLGHACWDRFLDALHTFREGDVLEIGSRARSGLTRRQFIAQHLRYTGLDVKKGPNVDVVGDAHALSNLFPARKFVAVFSLAVFEHLAMPWKVVVEMNRVLAVGGLVFVNSQQTWPVHEEPCDYWRFTTYAWSCLFNAATGFEIVEMAHGEPARVHPIWDSPVVRDIHLSGAFLCSSVIARKTAETSLDWCVPLETAAPESYPDGERELPPR
jgi:hypothetical protein